MRRYILGELIHDEGMDDGWLVVRRLVREALVKLQRMARGARQLV